jgi:uncharacterized protein GlcG (DUF336 family)
MTALTLDRAEAIARAALAAAREKRLNPMSISVIDLGGHLKAAFREDGAGLAGVDIALGKARAALTFGCTSKEIADALSGAPLSGASVIAALDGRVALLQGGVPIRTTSGELIGAVGAAGDLPANDEAIVLEALSA